MDYGDDYSAVWEIRATRTAVTKRPSVGERRNHSEINVGGKTRAAEPRLSRDLFPVRVVGLLDAREITHLRTVETIVYNIARRRCECNIKI